MADAIIASFDSKYLYNFWRPITAIHAAETDGNCITETPGGATSSSGTKKSDISCTDESTR